jgi:uncharacterized protein (DUF302 family)
MNANELFIEQQSPFDISTTVEKLIRAATAKEWQNPATHNLQQSLAKAGKIVNPVQVVELCKPKYSGVVLEKNHERIASIMMPCRISVYEKEDGKTYIALFNISTMTANMPATIIDPMNAAADELTEIVQSVIQ